MEMGERDGVPCSKGPLARIWTRVCCICGMRSNHFTTCVPRLSDSWYVCQWFLPLGPVLHLTLRLLIQQIKEKVRTGLIQNIQMLLNLRFSQFPKTKSEPLTHFTLQCLYYIQRYTGWTIYTPVCTSENSGIKGLPVLPRDQWHQAGKMYQDRYS